MSKKLFMILLCAIACILFKLDFHDIAFGLIAVAVYLSYAFSLSDLTAVLEALRDVFKNAANTKQKDIEKNIGGMINDNEEKVIPSRFTDYEEIKKLLKKQTPNE